MAALEAIYRWRQQPEIVEVKPEESSEEEKEEKYVKSISPKSDSDTVEELSLINGLFRCHQRKLRETVIKGHLLAIE